METLVKGICTKANFLDIFENFILFDDSTGKLAKIVARTRRFKMIVTVGILLKQSRN
ncbi:hypothetical protein [Pseudophaeobacter sp.]|jgi:type I restriction enzyme R subunit|uniref:hypothetical protein n=1 Tax=Pseudophaeobacter sp. TaxID=1971739 RepID=UPI0025EBAB0C|nr:hypothetical protein [uncultured Pseudophaeobacter sp.]